MKNLWPLALPAIVLLAVACNSATDDPGKSESQVSVLSVNPLTACVDWDGTLIDENGDGTFSDPQERFYSSVVQSVTLNSRVRGQSGGSIWDDALFSEVTISYAMDVGFNPPPRTFGVSITVPSGGVGTAPLTTVLADDIPGFFGPGDRGTIMLTFRGRDAGNHDVSASGNIPIETATVCR